MPLDLFLKGLAIGFSIAAPVGPIGVLCIRRTLANGRSSGLASGLGAATADVVYGCVAGFGLTLISNTLIRHQLWFRLVGGVFLCYLGLKTLLVKPNGEATPVSADGLVRAYASTFLLTITNPVTILSFAAIFAAFGGTGEDYVSATVLVLGVFIGSSLWWLTLSTGVSMFRAKFTPHGLRWVNRASGVVIVGFGLLALLGMIKPSS